MLTLRLRSGALLFACLSAPALAQSVTPSPAPSLPPVAPPPPAPAPPQPERFSIHGQVTDTQQYHGGYAAAYSGAQSLYAFPDTAKTVDATLFLGALLWKGGAVYINPEIDQGFGLGQPSPPGTPYFGTIGIAGFPSGEAYKVGSDSSYARIMRFFVRQTIDLGGGDPQQVEPDLNQLGGTIDPKHLIITAGKISVVDVFDTNPYAHDTKHDFLNWTIIDMGSFDYAADSWGYTYGLSAEYAGPRSAVRLGLFQLSQEPNQIAIEHVPFAQFSPVVEYEQDTSFFGGHPGAIKGLVYGDYGFMGSYADAISAAQGTGEPPSTAAVRTSKHWKFGAGINLSQEIVPNIGVFARLSAMNGTWEAYEFTDADQSISLGLSLDGHLYRRPYDRFGLAGAFNSLSAPAKEYFAAGGLGILVGDGALSYAGEDILETYYTLGITRYFGLTFDYQFVSNPAYNSVRGPVSIFGLKYHAQI